MSSFLYIFVPGKSINNEFFMEEILITEEELEYLTDIPERVCEEAISYNLKKSFERESKDCITLEEFSKLLDEAINRLIPNP